MGNTHPLDIAYYRWCESKSDSHLDSLLTAVRNYAYVTVRYRRDVAQIADDIAQDVALVVLEKLPSFRPTAESGFLRWVSRIIARTRAGAARDVSRRREDEFNEDVDMTGGGYEFYDLNSVPGSIREIARLLQFGNTVDELAAKLDVERGSVLRKVRRACPEIDPSAARGIEG